MCNSILTSGLSCVNSSPDNVKIKSLVGHCPFQPIHKKGYSFKGAEERDIRTQERANKHSEGY